PPWPWARGSRAGRDQGRCWYAVVRPGRRGRRSGGRARAGGTYIVRERGPGGGRALGGATREAYASVVTGVSTTPVRKALHRRPTAVRRATPGSDIPVPPLASACPHLFYRAGRPPCSQSSAIPSGPSPPW